MTISTKTLSKQANRYFAGMMLSSLIVFATSPALSAEPALSRPKAQVRALLKSIETGDRAALQAINPQQYIQHNLGVADGLPGLKALLDSLPKGAAKVNTVRLFQDGDHVFAHTEYDFGSAMVGFDIFRFDKGRIVEHWDNLQPRPEKPNPSGHTMTDGPVAASQQTPTADNRALVRRFVDDVLVNGRMEQLAAYFDGDNYRQHNPQIADGVSGLAAAIQAMTKQGISLRYTRIHQVLGDGDFVLTVSEGLLGEQLTAFYDLFRVAEGKIAEHWDVVGAIPARANWKNANGKF